MFLVSICTLPVTIPVPLSVVSDQTAGQYQRGWRTQHSVLRPQYRCVCAFFGPILILVPTCTVPVTVPVVSDQTEGQHQRGWRTQHSVLRPQRRRVCTFLVSSCSYLYVPVTVPVVSDQTEGQHQRGWRTQHSVLRPQRRRVCTFLVSSCSYLYCTCDRTCGFRPSNKAASAWMEDPAQRLGTQTWTWMCLFCQTSFWEESSPTQTLPSSLRTIKFLIPQKVRKWSQLKLKGLISSVCMLSAFSLEGGLPLTWCNTAAVSCGTSHAVSTPGGYSKNTL